MIDAELFLLALGVGAAWMPWRTARRYRPRVDADLSAIQRDHERGYRRRLLLRLLAPILLVYFLARAATAPPYRPENDMTSVRIGLGVLAATFVLSALAATLWRYRSDRAFIARHPEFEGSLQPLSLRLMGPGLVLVAFSLLGGALASQDDVAVFAFLAAALVALFGGQRLVLAALVRSRVELPLDSPFGRIAAETVARFGFTPKRMILMPTTVANAFALPDGTVMVTTALRTIATDAEIAAVLAHELSHARDRDVPRMRRTAMLVWLLTMAFAGGVAYGLFLLPGALPFLIPVVVLAVSTFSAIATSLRTPMLHRMEFKCDRAAADMGLGAELARCLTKLHRHMGVPTRWPGIERRLVTHPSLDDRLARLK